MSTCAISVTTVGVRLSVKKIGPRPEDTLDRPGPGYGHSKNFDPPPPPAPPPPPGQTLWQRWLGRYLEQGSPPPAPMQWEYDSFIGTTDSMGNILIDEPAPPAGGTLTIGAFSIAVGNNEAYEFDTEGVPLLPPRPMP